MKYFIVADVHSFYDELMKALNDAGWTNADDQCFVSLGDLCDRGPDTIKTLQFVNDLPKGRKILIRGNHEDLMESAISRGYFQMHDIHNCTTKTAEAIAKHEVVTIKHQKLDESDERAILEAVKNSKLWNDYFNSTVNFAEVGKNIFVHGWIPCKQGSLEKQSNWRSESACWERARWINGMKAWKNGAGIKGKTIWCGHWHTSWGHAYLHNYGVEFPEHGGKSHFSPFIDEGIVAMDGMVAFSHKLNCKVLEEEND